MRHQQRAKGQVSTEPHRTALYYIAQKTHRPASEKCFCITFNEGRERMETRWSCQIKQGTQEIQSVQNVIVFIKTVFLVNCGHQEVPEMKICTFLYFWFRPFPGQKVDSKSRCNIPLQYQHTLLFDHDQEEIIFYVKTITTEVEFFQGITSSDLQDLAKCVLFLLVQCCRPN